ncbi:MAG TPA: hypothetical protein VHO03_17020 [Ignavibacteriales bacterium]|nr:hypothetical protein [Ignavibacteriales bacterium]
MTEEVVLAKIIKYTAPFVVQDNLIYKGIAGALAKTLAKLSLAIDNLSEGVYTGKGLKKFLESDRLFFNNSENDTALQTRLGRVYEVLQARGSEDGIKDDLQALLGASYVSCEFKDFESSGIILDTTYPGVDESAAEDLGKAVLISFTGNISYYKAIIEKFILPIDCLAIYKSV